jgi:hypothetical protein
MVVRFRVTYQGDDERVFCNPLSGRPLDPTLQPPVGVLSRGVYPTINPRHRAGSVL